MVTLATGGMGLIPYAAGISAATGVSIGLDDQIRQALAEGRVVAATDRASYHLPFVGTSRNIYAAYQQGAVLGMGFHVSLLSVEAFGLRGAWKGTFRGKPTTRTKASGTSNQARGETISPSAKVGLAREQKVAKLTGGKLFKDARGQDIKVKIDNVASTGLDVIGKNGEYISVGGPSKAKDLSKWGQKISTLKKVADKNGVKAQAYLSENTPESVINIAKKHLGENNVIIFKE